VIYGMTVVADMRCVIGINWRCRLKRLRGWKFIYFSDG